GGAEREKDTGDSGHHAKAGRERPAPQAAQSRRPAHGSTRPAPSAWRVSMTKRCPTKQRTTRAPPTSRQEETRSDTDGSRIAARTSAPRPLAFECASASWSALAQANSAAAERAGT